LLEHIIMSGESMVIPTRISIEQINQLIQGFYFANALKSPVSSKEAAGRTSISTDVAGRNTGFLCDIGILIKEGAGYRLTDLGAEYAQWLSWKNENEASRSLSKILKQFELAEKIIHYVRLAGPTSLEDVVNRVGVLDGSVNTPHNRRGAEAFVHLLVFSGLLELDDDTIRVGKEKAQLIPDMLMEKKDVNEERQGKALSNKSGVTISINIDSQTNPDRLREIIRVLREELLERNPNAEDAEKVS
jgi:hypothetical protein